MKRNILLLILFTSLSIAYSQEYDLIVTIQRDSVSIKDIRKNSIYIENIGFFLPTVNYNRIIPFSYKTGFILKGGLSYLYTFILIYEATFLFGGPKNFFETGLGCFGHKPNNLFGIVGYRYMGNNGLLYKVGLVIGSDFVFPRISIGYSF
jgi:hypothetical protein